ncbi:MAG: hypothetical protein DHS20C18_40470 [Saprospiraceae bacterium]|nr:MAG: hypothetical protein DHS20C18_40470 [Saprospiraceae bacterium]
MATKQKKGPGKPKSRLDHVRAILNKAAGDSTADYQGYGRFWDLPLKEFLEVSIYSIRMIAPLPEPIDCSTFGMQETTTNAAPESNSCCGNKETQPPPASSSDCCSGADTPTTTTPGRGAKSGLIIGLKGEFPFDGSHFPLLPWGGTQVSAEDILYISNWIDDGCPDEDHQVAVDKQKSEALATGQEAHVVSDRPTNVIKNESDGLKQRKNIEFLTEDEICKFRYAIQELLSLDKFPLDNRNYTYWGRLHGDECQHGWEQFLTWHRMFLYEFEQRLQDVVPDVTLPYWNWPMDMYLKGFLPPQKEVMKNFSKKIKKKIPREMVSGVIPTILRCYLTEEAAKRLVAQGVPASISEMVGFQYNSGLEFFWGVEQLIGKQALAQHKLAIRAELLKVNPLWYPYRYPANFYDANGKALGEAGMQSKFNHHYPRTKDVAQILQVSNWTDFGGGPQYDASYGVLDMNPHNTIHIWSGGFNPNFDPNNPDPNEPQFGDMLNNLTAGYDPIFWPHHSNVDRLFNRWQELHPGLDPADTTASLSGLDYTVKDALTIKRLGYEYVIGSYYVETNQGMKMSKFNSTKLGTSSMMLANHLKAELRLHNVIQPSVSYGLRVFINQPDADSKTPVTDNPNYAGFVSFFGHGDCIGGPGHCDPPKNNPSRFDFRSMHHNTPRNVKLDVTDAVKKLVDKGANDLQISLVVIGPGSEVAPKLLQMNGLSMNFSD